MAHGTDHDPGNHRPVRVGADDRFIHDLLGCQNDLLRCEGGFLLLADDPPQVGIPIVVGALHVDNGHIRVERGDDDHILASVRIWDALDVRIGLFQVGRAGLVHGQEGQSRGAGLQAGDHPKVGIFLPLQLSLLDGRADNAQ